MGRVATDRERRRSDAPFLPPGELSFDDATGGFSAIISHVVGGITLSFGVILLSAAYYSTNASVETLSEAIIAQHNEDTMWCFTVGVAASVGGGLMIALGFRK